MSQLPPARILVVDDDPTITTLLNVILTKIGYQVSVAATGEEALDKALQYPPDLAILDVMLPGLDGYAVCRRLRQNAATRLLPILMLTAQGETADKLAGFDAGADDYLTKPFDPTELLYRVRGLLTRRHSPPLAEQAKAAPHGRLIAVFGTKGGVGKTTVAVNLAVALTKQMQARVVLMDGDFAFGDIGVHLNLSPSRSILDLLKNVNDLDETLANQVLIPHDSGVSVLLSPYRPEAAERIKQEHVEQIGRFLRATNDFVVVDCRASYDDLMLAILEQADDIVLVLTPEIGPVKNTSVFLDLAEKLGIPSRKIHLILNRANSDVGIAPAEVERALQQPVTLRLVSGGRAVVLSVNRGVPLVLEQPSHPFSQQMFKVAELFRVPVHS